MISHNLKWFLGLSVAVHTAALIALAQPQNSIGASGRTLLLSVSNHSGEAVAQPQDSADNQAASRSNTPPKQSRTAPRTKTVSRLATHQPVEKAIAQAQPDTPAEMQPETSSPAQAASSTLSREEQQRHLRASLMKFITRQLDYPAIARRKGWQGVVKLELLIESDGRIAELHVEQTSGYSLLDKAALQSLQLAHVPDAAQWLEGKAVSIVVPVEYRLVDG